MKKRKTRHSFRTVLSLSTLVCWMLPIIIITTTAGMLLNRNYNRNLRRAAETDVRNAMWQVDIRLNSVMDDASAVSYDGIVDQAYSTYTAGGTEQDFIEAATEYLNLKFSRSVYYRAVLISLYQNSPEVIAQNIAPGISKDALIENFHSRILPAAVNRIRGTDGEMVFMVLDGEIFLLRELADASGTPYALLVMELEKAELIQSLYGLSQHQILQITLDGQIIHMGVPEEVEMAPSRRADMSFSYELDGHTLEYSGQVFGLNIWATVPMLRWMVMFVGSLVVPMLVIIVWLFLRNINHPIELLIDATSRIRQGERGFQVTQKAPNGEFQQLYANFNAMSCELKSQFEQLYEEQQALQQAKIMALQSQINPHFLNNTLEIINWEARLAENDRVCSMIEALSTMLDAAIGRDGRSQVQLSEELKYVDAYLHITKQRIGDRLTIDMQVQPETLGCTVPLLMLQPILENAVEYDLTRTGGELQVKIYLHERLLHLEITHDGSISCEGWAKIRAGLHPAQEKRVDGRSVGIRNVLNRLSLFYGENFVFDIRECSPGKIMAEIVIPASCVTN